MTTVAFDGVTMAADTLATDSWGMKETVPDKIRRGNGFLMAGAGQNGDIERWWKSVNSMSLAEVLNHGYPSFSEANDPAIMLSDGENVWRHVSGGFFKCSRRFHAIGSGRDYALAAMYLGMTAREAVKLAAVFDNNTGGDIVEVHLYPLAAHAE